MKKIKIAIFDLTDCEGCELELINLREKLVHVVEQTDIANWRFASNNKDLGPFDVTFIEGSPITDDDIAAVKQARANSTTIVALGSCAALGGIQATLNQEEWLKGLADVYGKDYVAKGRAPRPLSYYVKVDISLSGCPVNQNELAKFLAALISRKTPVEANYPVCLECKAKENECLLLAGEPCLGPVTKGGCEAICPSVGLRCWGCFGLLEGSNVKALKRMFEEKFGQAETENLLKTFNSQVDGFKELYPTKEEK